MRHEKAYARQLARPLWWIRRSCAFAILLFGAAQVLTFQASRGRISENAKQAPKRTVAVVLGALVYRSGRLSDTVEDRVACGLALYRNGKVKRVLVSGDHGRKDYDEVNAMGAALLRGGVRREHLFLDHAGFRTLDSMDRARRVFGVRDAIICSQRFHLQRSIYLARRLGIDAVGVVSDRRVYRGELYNNVREPLARTAAVLDIALGREARILGPELAIAGDGRVTHDRNMAAYGAPW